MYVEDMRLCLEKVTYLIKKTIKYNENTFLKTMPGIPTHEITNLYLYHTGFTEAQGNT